jgi:Holliday junction resolvase RusA-like endonuclease
VIIDVRGLPAPQGSKRHVGGGRTVEQSKAVGPWREAVRAETQRVLDWNWEPGRGPLTGPVRVALTFKMARPKSHFGTGRNAGNVKLGAPKRPAGQPDLDKLARAVLDGLTAGGAWKDDSQVVMLVAEKLYGAGPGCRIVVTDLEET